MSPPMPSRVAPVLGFPRVSGDEPSAPTSSVTISGFSPRERG